MVNFRLVRRPPRRGLNLLNLHEDMLTNILSRLDLLELSYLRRINKRVRLLTTTRHFAQVFNGRVARSLWLMTQYRDPTNPRLGRIRAVRNNGEDNETVVIFDLGRVIDIRLLPDVYHIDLVHVFRSWLFFRLDPIRDLLVVNLEVGRSNRIACLLPPFNQESFDRYNDLHIIDDPQHQFHYIIIYFQLLPHEARYMYFEYRSHTAQWTKMAYVEERQNLEGVNISDPRSMVVVVDHDKLFMVSLEGERPVFEPRVHQDVVNTAFNVPSVFPFDVEEIAKVAFKEPGRFEVNAEIRHLMGFGWCWSRGSPVWLVTTETVKVEPPNPTLYRINLFRLKSNWTEVYFVSKVPSDKLPKFDYELSNHLLHELEGVVHFTMTTNFHGNWEALEFNYDTRSYRWSSKDHGDLTVATVASPSFFTRLTSIPN
ncbi:hypothetical protein Tco_0920746 [Tanacetum coccineum]